MQQLTPSPELYGRIINNIAYEKQLLKLKRMFAINAGILFTFSFLLVSFLREVGEQMTQSGFFDLVRLSASDFSIVTSHLHDYILSLAESLPIISTGLLVLTILFVLISVWKLLIYSLELKHLNANHMSQL